MAPSSCGPSPRCSPEVGAWAAAERTARHSYGRLLALLAGRGIDLAIAEDALGDAFRAALEAWPKSGIPSHPEAWLLTAARRRFIDGRRHDRVRSEAAQALRLVSEEMAEARPTPFGDERLKLLFVCAHPAIDPALHAPLMLQTVLGLDAARIAAAFLVSPAAMAQRLVRAKSSIRDAALPFAVPEHSELAPRLDAVLDAIYAAYGSAWEDVAGADPRRRGLAEEAIWLARLTAELLPQEPEAKGLLALLLHCEARRGARRDADGAFVPLAEQDMRLWSQPMVGEAEHLLAAAAGAHSMGRYQLEAAIQSVHSARARTGRTDWEAAALLYEGLARLAPTMGALLGRAAATAEARGAEAGWRLLQEIPSDDTRRYQPYWALRAHLLRCLGRTAEARIAYERAAGLSEDPAVRAFLLRQCKR